MPGESLQRDLSEVLEYWGESERFGIPARDLSRYLLGSLVALSGAVRSITAVGGPGETSNAEAGAHGAPETVGAQTLSSLEVGSDDPEG